MLSNTLPGPFSGRAMLQCRTGKIQLSLFSSLSLSRCNITLRRDGCPTTGSQRERGPGVCANPGAFATAGDGLEPGPGEPGYSPDHSGAQRGWSGGMGVVGKPHAVRGGAGRDSAI